MAAMVSVSAEVARLSFLEESTGFLVTFAPQVMAQIAGSVRRQLRGQFVQTLEKRAKVGFWLAGGHPPRCVLQLDQRVENLLFHLRHGVILV